jgi:hypothetical protein
MKGITNIRAYLYAKAIKDCLYRAVIIFGTKTYAKA